MSKKELIKQCTEGYDRSIHDQFKIIMMDGCNFALSRKHGTTYLPTIGRMADNKIKDFGDMLYCLKVFVELMLPKNLIVEPNKKPKTQTEITFSEN